jgi:hypothetical protein
MRELTKDELLLFRDLFNDLLNGTANLGKGYRVYIGRKTAAKFIGVDTSLADSVVRKEGEVIDYKDGHICTLLGAEIWTCPEVSNEEMFVLPTPKYHPSFNDLRGTSCWSRLDSV